jgi:two-component system, cell cycle response regulator
VAAVSPPRTAAPIWLGYLMLGVLVAIAYFLVAPDDPDLASTRIVLYCAVSASAAIAVFVGVARHRPRPTLAWG